MNRKEEVINEVLNIALYECGYSFHPITREDVLGKRGPLPVQMTRAIFVTMLALLGYDKSIIASYMNRTIQDVECILNAAHEFWCIKRDWTYLISESECTKKCSKFKEVNG